MVHSTQKTYPAQPEVIKEYLTTHLVQPVRFTEEIEHMGRAGRQSIYRNRSRQKS